MIEIKIEAGGRFLLVFLAARDVIEITLRISAGNKWFKKIIIPGFGIRTNGRRSIKQNFLAVVHEFAEL
jgi:hypothetical protein